MTRLLITTALTLLLTGSIPAADPPSRRPAWTTPFVTGSPEPPPAYQSVRAFPNVQFKNPVVIEMPPGDSRWWVAEPEGKLSQITPTADGGRVDVISDFRTDLHLTTEDGQKLRCTYIYGIAFHPRYAENREVFLAYTMVPPKAGVHLDDGTRVSRFKVIPGDVPRLDFSSEELLLTFREGGHNGACLEFGHDGCLLISTGDAGDASPPDMHNTGQDNRDLLSCILRIDVDGRDEGRAYAVPNDNPFRNTPDFRPEIWAYGFRNPWKMSVDRGTGQLWVGDIGWELWEMVHRVERGGNYGWSVMEGPQPIRVELPAGPQPVTSPVLALPHTAAASITGGFVYRGKKFPELVGKYIFGDWETHRLWSLVPPGIGSDGQPRSMELTELTAPTLRIIDFGQDHDGELVIMDYDAGTLHQLERNDVSPSSQKPFPKRLSETGLFASVSGHVVVPGVVPFEIAAEQWMDGAVAERFVAVPGTDPILAHRLAKQTPGSMFRRHFEFPKDSVLMKTISVPGAGSLPARRIETQLLHFDGYQWQAYTYRWNDAQTDGDLVPEEGDEAVFEIADERSPSKRRPLHWTFASRSQCITCHTPWAESTLAFSSGQLLTPLNGSTTTRLDDFERIGLLTRQTATGSPPKNLSRWDEESILVPPFDDSFPLDQRARSYLDANCAHCHRFGGGGAAQIDLRAGIPLAKTKAINEVPTKGDLGLSDARIIVPGNPWRSVLFLRMATCGRGRMPHLASEVVDQRGLALVEQWIRSLSEGDETESRTLDSLLQKALSTTDADARRAAVQTLLGSRAGALYLARALDGGQLPAGFTEDVITVVSSSASDVCDLFRNHLPPPPSDRVGQTPRPRLILARSGDPSRGEALYRTLTSLNCKTCHRVGLEGGHVGPDLTRIGRMRRREELLESLLNPSAIVDPKYASFAIQLTDGRVMTGVLADRNATRIEVRDAKGNLQTVPLSAIEQRKPQRLSLMPEGLLKDLTLQEAADLLAYLQSLQ